MTRPLSLLAGLVLALSLLEGWLASREARARAEGSRVGALFTRAEAEELRKQPALRVEAAGETHSFGRVRGEWRCLSLFGAPADGRAIESWLAALLGAEGIVHASETGEAAQYGINAPGTVRVSIQGPRAAQDPGGDVLATLELGLARAGGEGTFVRKRGTREIWAVAGDLRAPLAASRGAAGLPPLLAPAATPPGWVEAAGGVARVAVEDRARGTSLALARRERGPEEVRPGAMPWKWVLEGGGDPGGDAPDAAEAEAPAGDAFADYVARLPYVAVLDPGEREARGCASPRVVVTLEPRAGAPLALAFGSAGPDGRIALWVEASGALYEVEPGALELAAPARELLAAPLEEPGRDPWSAALGEGAR